MKYSAEQWVWVSARFMMGFMFLWAFIDKVCGLGFSTAAESSWLSGSSPTAGFLSHATGWFAPIFQALVGVEIVDWLFMLGLLLLGLSLFLGVGMRIAGWSGALLVLLMWLANFPPTHNPVIDEHTVYAIVLIGLAVTNTKPGQMFGFGRAWSGTSIVKRFPWLE